MIYDPRGLDLLPAPEPLTREPLLGAVCDSTIELGGCYHDSCAAIEIDGRIRLAEGPICGAADYMGECPHASCDAIEPPQGDCTRHGWQLVTDAGSGSGFAGGRIWWVTLACGCTDMDESGDVEAAR